MLTNRDELAFSRAVREFSPDVLFLGHKPNGTPRDQVLLPNISHDAGDTTGICVPTPGQERQWRINLEMNALLVRPHVGFYLERSRWEWPDPSKKWTFDLPLYGWGEVGVSFPREDEDLKKFAGKLLRLINKILRKGGFYGLDACLWSQAGIDERRGLGSGKLIDPAETIKLNKYYDDSLWDDQLPPEPTWSRNIELPDDLRRVSDDEASD